MFPISHTAIFLLLHLLLFPPARISCQKVVKCCPLDQVMSEGGCVNLPAGTSLPSVRVMGSLVTFQWLAGQDMVQEGPTPSCTKLGEVYPDFTETAASEDNVPHFSDDGVFVHELKYYLPGQYCVDGELEAEQDYYGEGEQENQEVAYEKVVMCEEKAKNMGECALEDSNCHPR